MKEYIECAREMLEFIDKSPTCFQAVKNVCDMLTAAGFAELGEADEWKLEKGKGYFVTRNESSVIAFRIPEQLSGFHIAAAHSDSPSFKVKESPESTVEEHYVRLNTEKYGGMILSTWLDRALSVAGRIAVNGEKGIETRLVNVDKEDIMGHDLFLYTREKGRLLGESGEFVLAPRLDDLQCAFSVAKAFAESTPEQYVNVCAVFDNEEVGSGTKQGADSTFLEDVLWRVCEALGLSRSEYLRLLAESFLISADNAHAVHPNHPEKADPTNRPYLNGGIVIKYHGSQKYTTDAVSAAKLKALCKRADVPFQTYANRSDIAGGSTLGNISTAHVSVSSVDIGLPQLAMHSAVETAGMRDTKYAVDMLKVFFGE